MHPSSIMSYYPTYSVLDEIVSFNNYETLHIYVDLKNCLQSIYMEHTIVNLVESTKLSGQHDTSVFTSLLSFLSFHRVYAAKRHIKIKFFVFYESGRSYYHSNISKDYKISRRIDDLYGLNAVDRQLFFDIIRNNLSLVERAGNKMPDINVLRLLNFEADFIPYYLITRKLVDTSPSTAHVVYSNDHDLCQTLNDHCFIFSKVPYKKRIVKKGEGMKSQLKCDCDLGDDLQPLAMAVIGDPGDDVYGVKGVGPKRFLSNATNLLKMTGGMEKLYGNIQKGAEIFDTTGIIKNKYINKILSEETNNKLISKNLRLVSFELISRVFDDPDTTELNERREKLLQTLQENEIVPLYRMREVLEMHRIDIQGDDLENIYHGYGG